MANSEIVKTSGTGQLGIKVFSATKARDRELLGETITDWIRQHPDNAIIDKIVTQSSDAEFHCLAITIVFRTKGA
jgi:hypothetical protein